MKYFTFGASVWPPSATIAPRTVPCTAPRSGGRNSAFRLVFFAVWFVRMDFRLTDFAADKT